MLEANDSFLRYLKYVLLKLPSTLLSAHYFMVSNWTSVLWINSNNNTRIIALLETIVLHQRSFALAAIDTLPARIQFLQNGVKL